MAVYIFLLPVRTTLEELMHFDKYITEKTKDSEDTILVLINNLDRFQLLGADHYSNSQVKRKIDKLTELYKTIYSEFIGTH